MIASLRGIVESFGPDWTVVDVHGIGYQVYMPTSTMSQIGIIGEEVALQTHLVMREDSVTLYGFSTEAELDLFKTLIGVSGLGPRLGLAVLSAMGVEQVTTAIVSENRDMLIAIPGIGKKMAERLILELKDKVSTGLISVGAVHFAEENADVISALTSLGYSVAEASHAVAALPDEKLPVEEKVRLALQYFTSK